jgi:L-ascorbate metabolism protein UlaG (beta-lactamase superfamily)
MKITKYPQSCLLIEQNGKRILIDPGSLVTRKYSAKDLLPIDAILITHEHSDHADPTLINELLDLTKVPVVGNQSTAKELSPIVFPSSR